MTAYEFFELFGINYTDHKVYNHSTNFRFTDRYNELLQQKKIY